MSQFLIYGLASGALFAITLYGLIVHAHLLRKVLAINMMGSAIFLFFVAVADRNVGQDGTPDPVPHAMVLTGIVVAVSVTALALALVRRIHQHTGDTTFPEWDES